jgi:putative transposase
MAIRTYKYRLYPSHSQAETLNGQLAEACRLYNAALQERRDAWRVARTFITFKVQYHQLKEVRAAGDVDIPNYGCSLDVLRRVDRAFSAFFKRVKNKTGTGFPRFKSVRRYDSLTFRTGNGGCSLVKNHKLRVQGVGLIKMNLHRPIEGQIKTTTIIRQAGRWYACFSVECAPKPLPPCNEVVGIDVGITTFAALSNKKDIDNPHWNKEAEAQLRRAQRKVARRKKGSNRRRKAVQMLQRIYAHIRNQRRDFHHRESRKLVNNYGLIAVEKLNIKSLAGGFLAKSVNDAAWGQFLRFIAYKAEDAGRCNTQVNPNGTSQRCPCGQSVPKQLKERWHECPACGLSVSRDHASALEILRLGLSLQALTQPDAADVA